ERLRPAAADEKPERIRRRWEYAARLLRSNPLLKPAEGSARYEDARASEVPILATDQAPRMLRHAGGSEFYRRSLRLGSWSESFCHSPPTLEEGPKSRAP